MGGSYVNLYAFCSSVTHAPGGSTFAIAQGVNPDIDSGVFETVWVEGGTYVAPSEAQMLNVTSTSAEDAPGNTGLHSVLIIGVAENFAAIQEVVVLEGTTPVITSTAFRAVNNMIGIGSGSVHRNVGSISCAQVTSTLVVACMAPLTSLLSQAIFTVPKTKEGRVMQFTVRANRAQGQEPLIEFRAIAQDPVTLTQLVPVSIILDTSKQTTLDFPIPFVDAVPENTIITMEAMSDQDNTRVFADMYFTLEPNF